MSIKVYVVTADARPFRSKEDHYAPLAPATKRDENKLKWDDFNGRRFSRPWRSLRLHVTMPRLPCPDFYNFGVGTFVCNQRAAELAEEPLGMCGELLPVSIERKNGRFFLYNVTNCINALDYQKSKWESVLAHKKQLIKPAFIARRLGELSVFKIQEDFGLNIYCLERSESYEEGEFKAVVQHHALTGLRFELIWSTDRS